MSLSSALSIISSSLTANATQSAVVSRNVANASTPGYSRQIPNLLTNSYGGVDVASIVRQANRFLRDQATDAASSSAYHDAISNGVASLANSVDDASGTSGARSPSAMIAALNTALQGYSANPSDATATGAAVSAASDLAASLRAASGVVENVRTTADAQIAQSVSTINALLAKFGENEKSIVTGLHGGSDVAAAQDTRDQILSQLSQQIGITTTTHSDGSMSIYTDSGVTLFQDTARAVTFASSLTLPAGSVGSAVIIDGVPVTGSGSPMKIQSGALAGFAELRDTIATGYQAQLDQVAGGLIRSFAETDQRPGGSAPTIPGLFMAAGLTAPPSASASSGLAASIQIAASVDPTKGGNVFLLRDGGIGAPGNSAYTYNSGGGSAFNTRIKQLADGLAAQQSFDPAAGLQATNLSDYANASLGWLQKSAQDASENAAYNSALSSQATAALSNGVGVNLDAEMTNMLSLENSYATTSKLLTTVNAMFTALLNAA